MNLNLSRLIVSLGVALLLGAVCRSLARAEEGPRPAAMPGALRHLRADQRDKVAAFDEATRTRWLDMVGHKEWELAVGWDPAMMRRGALLGMGVVVGLMVVGIVAVPSLPAFLTALAGGALGGALVPVVQHFVNRWKMKRDIRRETDWFHLRPDVTRVTLLGRRDR